MRSFIFILAFASSAFAQTKIPANFTPVQRLSDCMAKDENDAARVALLFQLRECAEKIGRDYDFRQCGGFGGQLLQETETARSHGFIGSTLMGGARLVMRFAPAAYLKRLGLPAFDEKAVNQLMAQNILDEKGITRAFVALDDPPLKSNPAIYRSMVYEVDLQTGKILSAADQNMKIGGSREIYEGGGSTRVRSFPPPKANLSPEQLKQVKEVVAAGLAERASDPAFKGHSWKQDTKAFTRTLSKEFASDLRPPKTVSHVSVFVSADQMNKFKGAFGALRSAMAGAARGMKPTAGVLRTMLLGVAIDLLRSGGDPAAKAIVWNRDFLGTAHPDNLLNDCSMISKAVEELTKIEVTNIKCPDDRTKTSPIRFDLTHLEGTKSVTDKISIEPECYAQGTPCRDVAKFSAGTQLNGYMSVGERWDKITDRPQDNKSIAVSLVTDLVADRCQNRREGEGIKIDLSNVGKGQPLPTSQQPEAAD